MATKKFTNEQLNYFRLCSVITDDVPEGLRTVFKQEWNARYQAGHGQWLDVPANAADFYNMESPRNQRRNARLLTDMTDGKTNKWDCTCLFYAILFSDCLGPYLNTTVKTSVDELREIRNNVFHTADGRLTDKDFDGAMQKILAAFKVLGLDTTQVEAIKTQKSFPTDELSRRIQQQLNDEKKRYAKFNSFCVLPPKPSHDTTDRVDEVKTINHEMEKLRSTKKNETTVIYLSGNPGCGKSEIARQIGNEYFDNIPEEAAQQKFVFTFNVSSIDTLLQSYVDFAVRLGCDEHVVTGISASKDLIAEEKIKQIKSLINPKVQYYPSWLIIVDNVNDLREVLKYLPQAGEKTSGDGQILVTTQDSRPIPRDSYTYHYPSLKKGMKEDDAIALLAQISGITGDRDTLLNIASALDFQPLALACAAVYMQQVFPYTDKSEAKWEKYLQKIQEGKREATEEAYKDVNPAYPSGMIAAVKLALSERVSSNDKIMMHAFQFLSVIAKEPIPLKYVVQHVMNCLPDEDQDLVAARISSSSLVLSSEDEEMSKAVRVHQVIYHGLQKLFENDGFDILKLMSVFSDLPSFKNVYDVTKEEIIATRSLTPHFVAISGQLKDSLGHSDLTDESLTADCLFKAGWICLLQGSYKASEVFLELCLSIQQRASDCVPGDPSLDSSVFEMNKLHEDKSNYLRKIACSVNASVALATTFKTLGELYRRLMDYKREKIHLEAALAIEERLYKDDHPELALTLKSLGYCHFQLEQNGNSEGYLQRALAIQEKESVTKNDLLLADILIDLIRVLQSQEQLEKARSYHQRALQLEKTFHDIESPQLSATIHNLGLCSSNFENEQQATTFYEKSLAINESMYHANHPYRAITLIGLGRSSLRVGEKEKAKTFFEEALAICENRDNQNDQLLADALHSLGRCLTELRQYDKAQVYWEKALSIREKEKNENDPDLADTLNNLGLCLIKQKKIEKAQEYLERALSICEETGDESRLSLTLDNLGRCFFEQRQYEKAVVHVERELTIEEKINGLDIATALDNLGLCHTELKEYDKAKAYLERALSIREKKEDRNDPRLLGTLYKLGLCLKEQGHYGKAIKYLERGVTIIFERGDDEHDPHLSRTLNCLDFCLKKLGQNEKAQVYWEKAPSIRGKGNDD